MRGSARSARVKASGTGEVTYRRDMQRPGGSIMVSSFQNITAILQTVRKKPCL